MSTCLSITYPVTKPEWQPIRTWVALEALLGRPVDLLMEAAVENLFIWAGIERSQQAIYGA